MRRNPDGAPDPGIGLVGHLRGRPGSAAASSVVDRERSRSRAHEEGDGSVGGETANVAALIARAENVGERHWDDAVDAAGQFIDWQAWWSERMQESSTEEWKQKRMRSFGKRLKLQKKGKLLLNDKEPEHVQRALDETRLAEWKKWQKHWRTHVSRFVARQPRSGLPGLKPDDRLLATRTRLQNSRCGTRILEKVSSNADRRRCQRKSCFAGSLHFDS